MTDRIKMSRNEIFSLIQSNILAILPDTNCDDITDETRLVTLGANSMDRFEILADTISDVGLKIPLAEFAGLNIKEIINLIYEKQT